MGVDPRLYAGPPFVLEQLQGDVSTRLGIGQGMVMVEQVVAAVGSDGVQLVVRQLFEQALGGHTGAIKNIVRVIHLVAAEDGFQAALVKGFVVRYQR